MEWAEAIDPLRTEAAQEEVEASEAVVEAVAVAAVATTVKPFSLFLLDKKHHRTVL